MYCAMKTANTHSCCVLLFAICLLAVSVAGVVARTAMAADQGGSVQMVICGAQGAEVIDLPAGPRKPHACDTCPACHMATPAVVADLPRASTPQKAARLRRLFHPVLQSMPRPVATRRARAPPKVG